MSTAITPRELSKEATSIISQVYTNGAKPAEPHRLLTDLARSVTIVGTLLGGLSDRYASAGRPYADKIATVGRVFWGVVELAAPHTTLVYLLANWLKLATLLSLIIIVLGGVFGVSGMSGIGALLLAAIILLAIISRFLHRYMLTAQFSWKSFIWSMIALGIAVLLTCAIVFSFTHGDKIAGALEQVEKLFRWTAAHNPFPGSPKN